VVASPSATRHRSRPGSGHQTGEIMGTKFAVRVPAAIPATLSALILATCVGISGAVVYPPGPGGTCPTR